MFVVGVAEGKPRRVSQELNGRFDALGYCWSPDGKRIAYVWENSPEDRTEGQETETFLMLVDADGRNPVTAVSEKSTFGAFTVRSPNWREPPARSVGWPNPARHLTRPAMSVSGSSQLTHAGRAGESVMNWGSPRRMKSLPE